MEIDSNELVAIFFLGGMFGGVFLIYLAMKFRAESVERQHRERMAMIERGHIPPAPALDRRGPPTVALSFGIIIVGLGLGLMTLISVAAGAPETGIGVGGAIVILGAAFIIRSLLVRPESSTPPFPPLPPDHPSS
jgi:hypothetical protein